MAKMNWDRVNIENRFDRFVRKALQDDQTTPCFFESEERDTRRRRRSTASKETVPQRRARIRRIVQQMQGKEIEKLEYVIERWLAVAPAHEISSFMSQLGDDAGYMFQQILKQMTRRQEEMHKTFSKLAARMEAKNKRRKERPEKKESR